MKGYIGHIERLTQENTSFRQVLHTTKHMQLVLMVLQPSEAIGEEVHSDGDQFFRFEKGNGKVVIDGVEHTVTDGDAVVVPAGAKHNVINTSTLESLFLYTIYAPPHHRDKVVHETKAEAEADNESFDGVVSE
ncbi:MAG: cupin domain-containing protein [Patescibacteria group bacterium]|jgi:mannose-6-phosphate isomerase-like protein (cupin superfamily)